jgi:hypothetical protein
MIDTNEFIRKAKLIHGDKYDYSKTKYINCKEKIIIICPIHGEFLQTPDSHLACKSGCAECGKILQSKNNTRTKDEFIVEGAKVHKNKYDYTLVNSGKYKAYVDIICPIHGKFTQTVKNHLSGHGCWECYKIKNSMLKKKDLQHFIKMSKKIHRDTYDYSNSKYINDRTKIFVLCKLHGEFETTPNNHYRGNGCPMCKSSKGEIKVRNFLYDNKIHFVEQKKFEKCVNKRKLPFDFYLLDYNICIEYDGIQHYFPTFGSIPIEYIKHNDKIKTKYCKENNIKLIRIKYTKYDKIEEILKRELNV